MWGMAVTFVVVIILRYLLRLYQQNQILKEIQELEEQNKKKAALSALSSELARKLPEDTAEVNGTPKIQEKISNVEESIDEVDENEEEDFDEFSTGHNVTKRLTADGSRKFHLTSDQIKQGRDLNKELMERLAKRKAHTE